MNKLDRNIIGDPVVFVDGDGLAHHALILHAWPTSLNIAYVHDVASDSYGNNVVRETSVPFKEDGMSGFYIEA